MAYDLLSSERTAKSTANQRFKNDLTDICCVDLDLCPSLLSTESGDMSKTQSSTIIQSASYYIEFSLILSSSKHCIRAIAVE